MNAALHFRDLLAPGARRRLGARGFELDLAAMLNRARREELEALAQALALEQAGEVGQLRARLWRAGAELEAGGAAELGRPWQPVPVVLSGRLVALGPVRGLAPPSLTWPRPVPPPPFATEVMVDPDEPDTLEALLDRATGLLGMRLGAPLRDKGHYGALVAVLLGVRERGASEPDWRGEVEIKTVPVARERAGLWHVVEDPAISMDRVPPESKLGRVLWIARVANGDERDAPILSWYYQERDAAIAQLMRRALHTRPKGPRGARTRGWYLQKRFFAASGFLRTLNGPP